MEGLVVFFSSFGDLLTGLSCRGLLSVAGFKFTLLCSLSIELLFFFRSDDVVEVSVKVLAVIEILRIRFNLHLLSSRFKFLIVVSLSVVIIMAVLVCLNGRLITFSMA
jgi:hypothetical protein